MTVIGENASTNMSEKRYEKVTVVLSLAPVSVETLLIYHTYVQEQQTADGESEEVGAGEAATTVRMRTRVLPVPMATTVLLRCIAGFTVFQSQPACTCVQH